MNTHSRPVRRGRSIRRLAMTAAVVPAPIVGLSAATQAATIAHGATWSSPRAPNLPSCADGTLCTFQNSNYQGTRWDFAYNCYPHDQWFFVCSGANDQISSYYNNRAWVSYTAKNCPADSLWAVIPENGGYASNLNNGHWLWQDDTSMNDSISVIALGINEGVDYPTHSNPARGGC
jgi:Peptidase inhibitor family I36